MPRDVASPSTNALLETQTVGGSAWGLCGRCSVPNAYAAAGVASLSSRRMVPSYSRLAILAREKTAGAATNNTMADHGPLEEPDCKWPLGAFDAHAGKEALAGPFLEPCVQRTLELARSLGRRGGGCQKRLAESRPRRRTARAAQQRGQQSELQWGQLDQPHRPVAAMDRQPRRARRRCCRALAILHGPPVFVQRMRQMHHAQAWRRHESRFAPPLGRNS